MFHSKCNPYNININKGNYNPLSHLLIITGKTIVYTTHSLEIFNFRSRHFSTFLFFYIDSYIDWGSNISDTPILLGRKGWSIRKPSQQRKCWKSLGTPQKGGAYKNTEKLAIEDHICDLTDWDNQTWRETVEEKKVSAQHLAVCREVQPALKVAFGSPHMGTDVDF